MPAPPPPEPLVLETERLRLVAGSYGLTHAELNQPQVFQESLGARVPPEWPPEVMRDACDYFLSSYAASPELRGWLNWYIILAPGPRSHVLVGTIGFNGRPDTRGAVLLGYSVLTPYHNQGIATEASRALIQWACDHGARCVEAETYPELKSSIRVMEKCGMRHAGRGLEKGTIRYVLELDSSPPVTF